MKFSRMAAVATVLSVVVGPAVQGQVPLRRPTAIQYYTVRPVYYLVDGNFLTQPAGWSVKGAATRSANLPLTYGHAHGAWDAVAPDPGCPHCGCGNPYMYQLCVPNLLPSILHDLDRACDRLLGRVLDGSPHKLCIPILPVLPFAHCASKLSCCHGAGCASGCSACDLPAEAYPAPGPADEGNPFQDDIEAPAPEVIPLPAEARATLTAPMGRPYLTLPVFFQASGSW